jgi:hypothetical protein
MMSYPKVNQAIKKVKINQKVMIKRMSQIRKVKDNKNKCKSVSLTSTTNLIQTLKDPRYPLVNKQLFNTKMRVNLNNHNLNLKNRY